MARSAKVAVVNRQRAARVDLAALRRAALRTLRLESAPAAEVTISVVDDVEIRRLNRWYLKKNRPTDVLAFPQEGGGLLGDVVVSTERARVQAREYGHSLERELTLLVIHGVLHLLGYEDTTLAGRARMTRRQEAILDRVASSSRRRRTN